MDWLGRNSSDLSPRFSLRLFGATAFVQALGVAVLAGLAHAIPRESAPALFGTGALFFIMAWQFRTWEVKRGYWAGLGASMLFHGVWNGLLISALFGLDALLTR